MDEDIVTKIPFSAGVVSRVEFSPFNFCDSLVAISSHRNETNGQTVYHLTIARFHQKRAVGNCGCCSVLISLDYYLLLNCSCRNVVYPQLISYDFNGSGSR